MSQPFSFHNMHVFIQACFNRQALVGLGRFGFPELKNPCILWQGIDIILIQNAWWGIITQNHLHFGIRLNPALSVKYANYEWDLAVLSVLLSLSIPREDGRTDGRRKPISATAERHFILCRGSSKRVKRVTKFWLDWGPDLLVTYMNYFAMSGQS